MTTAFARPSVLMFGAALALSACDTADHFDRDPQPSPIVVDGQAIPEVARVQVPMPAVAMEPPRRGSAKASLFTARSQPLFSDQRADDIGDIVTVVISIDDRAQLRNSTDREREGQARSDSRHSLAMARKLPQFCPESAPPICRAAISSRWDRPLRPAGRVPFRAMNGSS